MLRKVNWPYDFRKYLETCIPYAFQNYKTVLKNLIRSIGKYFKFQKRVIQIVLVGPIVKDKPSKSFGYFDFVFGTTQAHNSN